MNKHFFNFFIVLIALFIGAIYYNNTFQAPIISSLNFMKTGYNSSIDFIENIIKRHFFQANEIEYLQSQLQQYENNHLVMHQLASEIDDLYNLNHSKLKINAKVELVRVISYAKFGDLRKLWLDFEDYNSSKVYGLTYKEFVAGIVINRNGKPMALLNGDAKSTYSVYVGKNKAPGIVHGSNSKYLIVNFIPTWFDIDKDDEVITSGLDNLFFKGLKVGKVVSVEKAQGYQSAIIEPYYMANEPNYFYVIKGVK